MLCAYIRLRYQVSVYRTIGPLVTFIMNIMLTLPCDIDSLKLQFYSINLGFMGVICF